MTVPTPLTDSQFLAAPKVLLRKRMRWRSGRHGDYSEVRLGVAVVGQPRAFGVLVLSAHKYVEPPKYIFCLVYRGKPVIHLDVGPRRTHVDARTLKIVRGTHWQSIPNLNAADEDTRVLSHARWLYEFLKRTNIRPEYLYNPPPGGPKQLTLL